MIINHSIFMIYKIIQFSIRNKFTVGLFTVALILYGSYSLTQLSIDAVPDITNNQVQVFTLSPSLAAQEVEQFVTAPIERSLASLPDLKEVRSISRFGLSVITIVFDDKVDIYFARTLVDQRLKEAQEEIPSGMGQPFMGPVSTGLVRCINMYCTCKQVLKKNTPTCNCAKCKTGLWRGKYWEHRALRKSSASVVT